MALKWGAVVIAAVSVTLFATANITVGVLETSEMPTAFNMATIAAASVGAVVAVLAEMYARVTARITALAEFVAARLNELDAHTGDRNAGFVEGYLLSHDPEAGAVVPFAQRAGRQQDR
ncbi:hypothetical protein O7635_13440 [Asanoa sp. WMMD1127]|uniref:hypothetical protein n=1 Tax=Asanoa sp. WMMD1127 TaxID=3016107 RepID=UPI00241738B3|nr:hypothetical protein [Asanoa sp. WMMD1127]MDG4822853.1 hypothetical protein [Asanoa sp. WMMD1127]